MSVLGNPRLSYIGGVATIALDRAKCNGCRLCLDVCPHSVFALAGRAVEIVRRDDCMECGACVRNCSEEALVVEPGVGCAAAILKSWVTRSEAVCG